MTAGDTVTGARRALGQQLAATRSAAGLTQHALARRIGWTRSSVANAECGQGASRAFWEQCDQSLSAGGAIIAACRQVEELQRAGHLRERLREQATRASHVAQWRAEMDQRVPLAPADRADTATVQFIHRTFTELTERAGEPDGDEPGGLEGRVLGAHLEHDRRTGDPLSITLVGGFAGSGKTEFARFLSRVTGWSILDKDTMTRALVEQLLQSLGGDPNDREGPHYQHKVRYHEYRCLMEAAYENLTCGTSTVLTAPFLLEFADRAWLKRVKNRCTALGAVFTVVWVKCDPESMYDYVTFRGAARDTWKIANWEAYLATIDSSFEPVVPHYTVDNRLNAAVALADQARDIAMRVNNGV
jgi:predicted kinase/DNA-binding XRE family transcriptional regulator